MDLRVMWWLVMSLVIFVGLLKIGLKRRGYKIGGIFAIFTWNMVTYGLYVIIKMTVFVVKYDFIYLKCMGL